MNETEIREKIVLPWLISLGFDLENLRMEASFKIRLGHGVFEVKSDRERINASGRADYLIKQDDTNLFIVEVKSEDEAVDLESSFQAISYARLILEGNMPPFVLATNGKDFLILDTVTKEKLCSDSLKNHNFFRGGYKIECDIGFYAEALEYLITLSADNLIAFCSNQIQFRMRLLKGNDISSGKKYIPQLYVNRLVHEKRLNELLFDKDGSNSLALITGPPQLGKTSFLCSITERFVQRGIPCLFYSAIGIKNGLFQAFQEDFRWAFNKDIGIASFLLKLSKILKKTDQHLIIVIDGLNEIDREKAYQISSECERLDLSMIKLVVSATSSSLTRLLLENGDPTFICDNLRLNKVDLEVLKYKQLRDTSFKNIIQIDELSKDELQDAKLTYSRVFNTSLEDTGLLLTNPFYLRGAAECFANSEMPSSVTDVEIIANNLYKKFSRIGIEKIEAIEILKSISKSIVLFDAPLSNLSSLGLSFEQVYKLVDCAILAETHNNNEELGIDFYFSRERDYSIAFLLEQWDKKFVELSEVQLFQYIKSIINTNASYDALKWFLSRRSTTVYLKRFYNAIKNKDEHLLNEVLQSAIVRQDFNSLDDKVWLEDILNQTMLDGIDYSSLEEEKAEEIALLLYKLITYYPENTVSTYSQKALIKRLLHLELTTEDYYFKESYSIALLDIASFKELFINELLIDEDPDIAKSTALLLAHNYDGSFIDSCNRYLKEKNPLFLRNKECYQDAIEHLKREHIDNDTYCGGLFSYDRDIDEWQGFLIDYQRDWNALIKFYSGTSVCDYFEDIIQDIKQKILKKYYSNPDSYHNFTSLIEEIEEVVMSSSKYQLFLPFDIYFIELNEQILNG